MPVDSELCSFQSLRGTNFLRNYGHQYFKEWFLVTILSLAVL